jgi:hypothetical protein
MDKKKTHVNLSFHIHVGGEEVIKMEVAIRKGER